MCQSELATGELFIAVLNSSVTKPGTANKERKKARKPKKESLYRAIIVFLFSYLLLTNYLFNCKYEVILNVLPGKITNTQPAQ